MKSIFAFIVVLVVVTLNEAQGARGPAEIDGSGSGSGLSSDEDELCKYFKTCQIKEIHWKTFKQNAADYEEENEAKWERDFRSFNIDGKKARRDFTGNLQQQQLDYNTPWNCE